MPMGMSRFGLRHSSAVVETASKPMKAKNTTAAPALDPRPAVGSEGMPVLRLHVKDPDPHEQGEYEQFDRDHHHVEARAGFDSHIEHGGQGGHDKDGGKIEQDRPAEDPRRRRENLRRS